jgi:hypothetical protein
MNTYSFIKLQLLIIIFAIKIASAVEGHYAMVGTNGDVLWTFKWDPETSGTWTPPEGMRAIPCAPDSVLPGDNYADGKFSRQKPADPESQPQPEAFTAEQWLSHNGYTATVLVGLLQLQLRLQIAGKPAPKQLTDVQAWVDDLYTRYAIDTKPRPAADWPPSPHTIETVIAASFLALK